MALSLPLGTQNLLNQGNALLAEAQQQGLAIHGIAFQQKAIGAKIEDMISKFSYHEVMSKPKDTIAVLQEVKSSFQVIKNNVNTLEAKEKEMNGLIQNIIARQQQGNAESAHINAQIASTQHTLNSIQEQINVTQANLNRMSAELTQLQKNIEDAERKLKKKRKRRKWWVIGTILTLGVAGVGAIGAFKSVKAAKVGLQQRREIYTNVENNFKNLQSSFQQNMGHKANLETDLRRRQFELGQIADILNRLQPSLQDTAKYRGYLLKLSDAFTQVNSYVQNLEKNLGTVAEVQNAGHPPDESMNLTISNDYKNFGDAWKTAKVQPAVQMALNLQDANNPGATLGAIKSLNLAGRKKRSLLDSGRSQG